MQGALSGCPMLKEKELALMERLGEVVAVTVAMECQV